MPMLTAEWTSWGDPAAGTEAAPAGASVVTAGDDSEGVL